MNSGDEAKGPRKSGAPKRAERLAAALKQNLKKRKELARVRRRAEGPVEPSPPASNEKSKG